MRSSPKTLAMLALALSIPLPVPAQEHRAPTTVVVDSTFAGMTTRNIGPAGTSGRIAALDAVNADPRVIYAGTATGGLWKTVDGGFVWEPIMDDVAVNSIGAVTVWQAAPDVVWVGTGEANARNSMGVGRGVWRTLDAGESWQHLGLERTEHIEAIVLHPSDPNVAYVSALGPAWSDGEERGVFRTTDGGASWRKILYADETTGAFELVMDPSNPRHLLASTWQFRRWPWFFDSGGPGSGLWQTYDGGDTWERLTEQDGLPEGELGRIGLAFATNEPDVVYALVEAEDSELLRSDDGGASWRTVNSETNVNPRAFYYSRVYVDPTNENRVYRVAGDLDMSEDGGRTFRTIARWAHVHVDHHAFWVDPSDGRTIISGNDSGVYISHNRGGTWRFVENLPLAQFYHLSVDMATPFNVYGGLQDNGSWMGPSQVWETTSFSGDRIMNHHWRTVGFGDGFATVIDATDPSYGYSMSQGGNLTRFDLATNEWKTVRPPPPGPDTELRFNWNAGIAIDPLRPNTVYYGSQFVHRTTDAGHTWEIISPDLTTDDPAKQRQAESGGLTLDVTAAENHTTILTIAPSPVQEGVIWVGTDDGNVQVTRDDGGSWTNVVDRIRGVPANTWVPHIEASGHDAATAYVVFDDHRRGNWETYIYRTDDYGRSWDRLGEGQIDGYVHVVEEDPVTPDLLFAGTEFGLYFSRDAGESWRKWEHDYPTGAPTRALVVHPRDHDLAIGTHGRAAWIIDDIRPLRELAMDPGITSRDLHLFEIPPAIQHTRGMTGPFYFPGHANFLGDNREYGALISYWVREAPEGTEDAGETANAGSTSNSNSSSEPHATIQILQGDSLVRTFEGPFETGVNRVAWDLSQDWYRFPGREDIPEEFAPSGPEVLPGTYAVRVIVGEDTATGSVEVGPDPRRERSLAAYRQKLDALHRVGARIEELAETIDRLEATKETIALVRKRVADRDDEASDSLAARVGEVMEELDGLLDNLRLPPDTKGIVRDTTVSAELGAAYGRMSGSRDAPTVGQLQEMDWAISRFDEARAAVQRFYDESLPGLQRELADAGFSLLSG